MAFILSRAVNLFKSQTPTWDLPFLQDYAHSQHKSPLYVSNLETPFICHFALPFRAPPCRAQRPGGKRQNISSTHGENGNWRLAQTHSFPKATRCTALEVHADLLRPAEIDMVPGVNFISWIGSTLAKFNAGETECSLSKN